MLKDLNGKVAIVTGAGRGIGKEIALTLARAGANVVVSDITDQIFEVAIQVEALNVEALPLHWDVSSFDQAQQAKTKILEKFKKVDILVNNAGIYPMKPFVEMAQEDWSKVLHVNLDSMFNCTKTFLQGMIAQKYGKIVNISSVSGVAAIFPNLVHYSASKAGIVGFTKALAFEVASQGVNVNAIAPGPIDVSEGQVGEALYEQVVRMMPVGRMGKPSDIANLVLFLVSDISNFITGQCIVCDGGYSLP
ncbi:MAG: SDR family NAD(P)-dependent oxidoreductase [Candidatus Bathyarchaeia archaeon]|jgi:3-oxoacyl-[acyl-carrier protein] reductase